MKSRLRKFQTLIATLLLCALTAAAQNTMAAPLTGSCEPLQPTEQESEHRSTSNDNPPTQHPVGFAYYDADRLYDTIPALFYNDDDFTPQGRLQWTSERYRRKIAHTAAVLDSMRMNLVAVAGVETEEVVRDLVKACGEDYCYVHRTLNGFTGLDIALLYHADRFDPRYTEEGRGWLYVEGRLDGIPVGLLLCRDARQAGTALTDCIEAHPDVKIIAAGCFSVRRASRHGMTDALARAERAGRGNIRYSDGWRMRERILTDTSFRITSGDVYARRFLMDFPQGAPRPTYNRTTYLGGYSRTLPVFTYLIRVR